MIRFASLRRLDSEHRAALGGLTIAARCFLFLLLALVSLAPARAQFIGYTSPQTVQTTLANNTTCTGSPQNFITGVTAGFSNLGQTEHFVSIIGSGVTTLQAEIDGLDNQGNVFRISEMLRAPTGFTNANLSGTGYYPRIQVKVQCNPGTGTFTLNYSGGSSTPIQTVGSYQVAQIDKEFFAGASTGSSQSDTIQTPFGNSLGMINFVSSGGAPAGSQIIITCENLATGVISIQPVFNLNTGGTSQRFFVPASNCPFAVVQYATGGASANTFNLEYMFTTPGSPSVGVTSPSLTAALNTAGSIVEKGARWSITSSPAAGSQATISKAAANNIRHVADCVTASAGAAAAPAATVLTINLRDGASGAGTVIWTTQITAAATAANHGNVTLCGLNLINFATATAMTLEFSAGLANESESVTLTGYDVPQ